MPAQFTLPSSARVRHRRDFARLKQQGHRLARAGLVLNWMELPPQSDPRLGLITTRKLGPAVVRNRCRRLLRESFRLNQHCLQRPADMIVVVRTNLVGKTFAAVQTEFLAALRDAGLIKLNA
ncbi:MAG: ribonuclease P protein component [Pedosphaera sp.]|nr:ribonuclease P protein component [Pedosphaera sp.]MSU43490.1 ribonuclease P protein component [Pedosphaera sp.]